MEGPVYPQNLFGAGIEYLIPGREDRELINTIIFDELIYGTFLAPSRDYFGTVISDFFLKKKGM